MNYSFPLRHWLYTLLSGALLLLIVFLVSSKPASLFDLFGSYLMVLIFSIFFSLPPLAIQYLLFFILMRKGTGNSTLKWALFAASVIELAITVLLLGDYFITTLIPVYGFASLLCCWLIKTPVEHNAGFYPDEFPETDRE